MINLLHFIMTLCAASVFTASGALAEVINQENFKTHLRWNLNVPRDQFYVVKKDQALLIETVNLQMFEKLAGELAALSLNGQYIETVTYSKDNFPARPATITVKLKDPSVELFSFYLDADKKYEAQIYRDGDKAEWKANPYDMVIEKKVVTAKDKLSFKLGTSGGVAIRFKVVN